MRTRRWKMNFPERQREVLTARVEEKVKQWLKYENKTGEREKKCETTL